MTLTNFKGIASFTTNFNHQETEFRGENGTGKTTLCDAFMWVLFGKDSYGRSDTNFQLKTLDKDNKVIPNIPHEVELVLIIDDEIVTLRKSYSEHYTKKRGKVAPVFDGHIIERYWNNVPLTETEYKNRIETEICPEETFRLITSPTYFLTQKPIDQRRFLINLVGNITPLDIAKSKPKYSQLEKVLESKTLEEYTKELAATLKRIKVDKEGIPERIDERRRDIPETEDWDALQKEIDSLNGKMSEIDSALADKAKAFSSLSNARYEIQKQINDIEGQMLDRATLVERSITKEYWDNQNRIQEVQNQIYGIKTDIRSKNAQLDRLNDSLIQENNKRNELLEEYYRIKDMTFTADTSSLVCPTCGREYDSDKREELIAKAEENFNTNKANLLAMNKSKGLAVKANKERIAQEIEDTKNGIKTLDQRLELLMSQMPASTDKPETASVIESDAEYNRLKAQKQQLAGQLDSLSETTDDTTALKAERSKVSYRLSELACLMNNKTLIENINKRIADLETQYRDICAEEVKIEGLFDLIAEFKKEYINSIEGSINCMFEFIKFKLYETLNNGNEREVCEALIDGVPYSTNVNTAGKINAGMDFINAIQAKYGISAPVWVDNRESITALLYTDCQVIDLVKDSSFKTLKRTE